jgi:hypothetical protein
MTTPAGQRCLATRGQMFCPWTNDGNAGWLWMDWRNSNQVRRVDQEPKKGKEGAGEGFNFGESLAFRNEACEDHKVRSTSCLECLHCQVVNFRILEGLYREA